MKYELKNNSALAKEVSRAAIMEQRKNSTGLFMRLLIFFSFSLLIHLLLIKGLENMINYVKPNIPRINRPLSIKITSTHSIIKKTSSKNKHTTQPESIQTNSKKIINIRKLSKKDNNQPHEKPYLPLKHTGKSVLYPITNKTNKKSEIVPAWQIYDSIPSILEGLEKQEADRVPSEIFNPKWRKSIEKYRNENKIHLAQKTSSDSHSNIIETGRNDDYINIRINNQCWKVPVNNGKKHSEVNVWTADLTCPKQKKHLFKNIKP